MRCDDISKLLDNEITVRLACAVCQLSLGRPVWHVCIDGHLVVNSIGYVIDMSHDPSTIAVLRRAFDEVLLDTRFYGPRSASALEIAEHLLKRAAEGESDLERLKSSAFKKLVGDAEQRPNQAL